MNSKTIGIALITFGLGMLLLKIFHYEVDLTLFFIGGCFLTFYFGANGTKKSKIGFLIPGCILIGLGSLDVLEELPLLSQYDDLLFFICLSAAFFGIQIIGGYNGNKVKWAGLVGFILLGVAGFIYLVKYAYFLQNYEDIVWPIILIVMGILLILTTIFQKIFKNRY